MNPFYVKLILSFLVGGIWITLVTTAAEKFGSKVGGLIGGLPSTVVVSMFFIAWTQGAEKAFHATTVFPVAMSFNAIFLIVYVFLSNKNFVLAIFGGIFAWFVLQSLLVLFHLQSFALSIILWILILAISYYILEHKIGIEPGEKRAVRLSPSKLIFRAIFSGTMIAFAVVMSKIGGAILGGIFSSFPAVFVSTLIITALSVDARFSRSMASPLMISGVINCVVFAIAFRYLILQINLLIATFLAYAISIASGYLTYLFIKHKTGNPKAIA